MLSIRRLVLAVALLFVALNSFGASQYPPRYRWRTITTDHFYVHYHTGEEDLAARAARIAEDAHRRVTPLLDWTPEERTHIVLSDNIDASNGSATFFPNNRIEIFVSAPGGDPSSPLEYYDNWLNLVITHEYAHILHLDQAFGLPGFLRRIFGRNPLSFPNAYSPLWMVEGIATLVESEATTAGRLKGTFVDMILRTSAIEKTWFPEPLAGGITPEWPGGSARYFYGSKFLEYVAKTEGIERLQEYFHEYATSPVPFRVDGTAYNVFGNSITEMYRTWSDVAQRGYLAEHAALTREGLTDRKRLTNLGYETKYTVLSPDGRLLAYGHRGPYEEATIRVLDVATSLEIDTEQVNTISHMSWSPDGKRIAFSQLEFKNTFSLLSDLYIWPVGSFRARQITSGKRLKDPAFTPDGRYLIAVENRAGRNRLVEVEITTGKIRPLVSPDDLRQFAQPDVSPDGSRIAVAEWNDGRIDIVLYSREGARLVNLTESLPAATNGSPRFTAGGERILFSGDVTGVSNIYSISTDGSVLERITNLYGGAFFPSSKDGETIYYTDYSGRGFDAASFRRSATFEIRDRQEPVTVVGQRAKVADAPARPPIPESPPSAMRDESYSPLQSLRPKWWFPVIASSSNETILGAQTSGADALGFHEYQAQFLASFGELDQYDFALIYSYDRLYPTLTAAVIQFDDTNGDVIFRGPDANYYYRETVQRTAALATVPFRRWGWQSFVTGGFIRDSLEQHLPFKISDTALDAVGLFEGVLQGYRAGLAINNARQSGYAVSPENGILATLDYENLSESLGSDRTRQQLRADVRGFLRIPIRRSPLGRHTLALRAAGGVSDGDFVFQREFRVGGADVGGLLRLDTTNFPVRGFDRGELRGENAAIGSVEYRFPIYEIERGPALYPIFFHRILGDVYFDTGTAWNDRAVELPQVNRSVSDPFDEGRTLASAGAEIGLDFFFGYFVPVRYRLGGAYILESPQGRDDGDIVAYLTAGTSF